MQRAVLDTETLERRQIISLSRPCVSLTLSKDGSQLYALDTLNGRLLVIDARTGAELRSIAGVGPRSVFAVLAP